MSETQKQPTEQELAAAYEAELARIRVEQVLLEQVVTMVNLGMRRTGLAPGTESERDAGQVRVAIEATRALMPLIEQCAPAQVSPLRQALSQLQLAYVRIGGAPSPAAGQQAPGAAPSTGAGQQAPGGAGGQTQQPERPRPGEPGPAQRSGRLWVPGQ
jgi:hypothetical protein